MSYKLYPNRTSIIPNKTEKANYLTFNSFSTHGTGSEYLRLAADIHPDENYFNELTQHTFTTVSIMRRTHFM